MRKRGYGSGSAISRDKKEDLVKCYNSYKNRLSEWRRLDVKERMRILRCTVDITGILNCLSTECSATSVHPFGLNYHLDRCGLDEKERPWKCSRCDLKTTMGKRSSHLIDCKDSDRTVKLEPEMEVELNETPSIIGMRRSAVRAMQLMSSMHADILAKDEEEENHDNDSHQQFESDEASEESFDETSAESSDEIADKEQIDKSVNNAEQPKIGSQRSKKLIKLKQMTIVNGKRRYELFSKHLKYDFKFTKNDIQKYVADIKSAAANFHSTHGSVISPAIRQWSQTEFHQLSIADQKEWVRFFGDKKSIPIRLKGDECPSVRLSTLTTDKVGERTLAYCGGPISSLSWCPNCLPNGDHLLAVTAFEDDEKLSFSTVDDPSNTAIVQLWSVQPSGSTVNLHMLIGHRFGIGLTCCWSPTGFDAAQKWIGALAVGTNTGKVAIFCIPQLSSPICPRRVVLLPALLVLDSSSDCPIISLSWSPFNGADWIAAVSAQGSVVAWKLSLLNGNTRPTLLIDDSSWHSPPIDVVWLSTYQIVVSFRERMVRIFALDPLKCLLQESSPRTAGTRLVSLPSLFRGFLVFQSQSSATNGFMFNRICYVNFNSSDDVYFVIPISKVHQHRIGVSNQWGTYSNSLYVLLYLQDVAISSHTGSVASTGEDGSIFLGIHGRLEPIAKGKKKFGNSINVLPRRHACASHDYSIKHLFKLTVDKPTSNNDDDEPLLFTSYERAADSLCLVADFDSV